VTVRVPHALVGALCVGIAAANVGRVASPVLAFAAVTFAASAPFLDGDRRLAALVVALLCAGWWWGNVRLDRLDQSVLAPKIGTSERARIEVDGVARRSRYSVRTQVIVRRFGSRVVREEALLELPPSRAPPQGSVVSAIVTVEEPRGPSHGFDEREWLRRKGIHVVLRADSFRIVGSRRGLGAVADRLRQLVERPLARGSSGDRRAVLTGIVLGDDQAVPKRLRDDFRRSGLYHLLAVSGQNVALVAAGSLMLARLLGLSRLLGELGALAGIAAYVLAVGPQPSVIRAGIVGGLASFAWIAARQRDRWHFLLLAALVLLAWNPYTLRDPGFELSFVAVAAIFVLVHPLLRLLEGYPLPQWLAEAVAVSTVCGAATAPILWLQFHAVPLLAVPANALAAPAMMPLLALALVAAIVDPLFPGLAAAFAGLAAWPAAWIALCARAFGAIPFAQVGSTREALALAAVALLTGAYAWSRWRTSNPFT
jgi:competence protein ComEC